MSLRQQQIYYANPRIAYLLGSRRYGKTHTFLAPSMYRIQQSLPGSTNAMLGSSRAQLLRRTVPAMMSAIEQIFGLKEGVHWGYGKPPKFVPRPIMPPRSWDSCIWFASGAYFQLISMATMGSANGLSLCSILGDEVKFIPFNKVQGEVLPALSGQTHPLNDERFSEWNPLYKSIRFASDASLTTKNNWLEKLESILEEEIEVGPFAGKTYGWLQDKLEQYGKFVAERNEIERKRRLAGGVSSVLPREEIDRINGIATRMLNHEGEFRIMPNYGKRINKAMLDMAVNYKLITVQEAEDIYNREWLLDIDTDMRMVGIKEKGVWSIGSRRSDLMDIRTMQREARCFFRANTIDNIDILGESYIRDMKRTLSPLVFQISILNAKVTKINDGFYANLDVENVHGYVDDSTDPQQIATKIKTATEIKGGTAYKHQYESVDFDMLEKIDDCSLDGDIADSLPLYIGMDYGIKINWVVTGQVYRSTDGVEALHVVGSNFVKNGKLVQDVVQDWCNYYAPHKKHNREVIYYFDHTAKFRYGISQSDYKDVVIEILSKNGWKVTPVDIGQAMRHTEKYKLINEALAGISYPAIRINRTNNEALIIALENADVVKMGKDFKKYKAGEKLAEGEDEESKLEYRTDGTDAFDTLYIGVKLHRGGGFVACLPSGRRR